MDEGNDAGRAGAAPHPWIRPVLPYLGRWRGRGEGGYPTLDRGFAYEQEIDISHDGRPFVRYEARAWLLDDDGEVLRPSGREVGWWRVTPDGYMEALLAHPTGIIETYLGRASGAEVDMTTKDVLRTPMAKQVDAARRRYAVEGDELGYVHDLAAVGTELTRHLSARLRLVGS
ncbi:FABP family protein [Actinomadura graeca]|uniref:FABP family protein n=1 Tax=Actinomadura graeca TaxID=2750812 RepID=UPI001E4799FF|nr:FABP family protein [Actinomadura graeca]